MCEILIKAIDALHIDPEKDKMCYKRGDAVVVMPDGHLWGKEEGLPKFVVVKIPGMSVAAGKVYTEDDFNLVDNGETIERVVTIRRKVKIHIDDFPAEAKNSLTTVGVASVRFDDIKNHIKDKITEVIA